MEVSRFQQLLDLGKGDHPFSLSTEEWTTIDKSCNRLINLVESDNVKIYGIHTGYGSDVLTKRASSTWMQNQIELLHYLTVGVGPELPDSVVRRALRLQIRKVSKGHSGIHPETVRRLMALSNSETLPKVPIYGSLGASGDLIPMAHAIAPVFTGYEPKGPRDVIGLVNTNSVMSSYAIEAWQKINELMKYSQRILALVMRSVNASADSVSSQVADLRSANEGYQIVSAFVRKELNGLADVASENKKWLQPRYSIRCAPMVLGNALDLLNFAKDKIMADAESVADNPLLFFDGEITDVMHAGLFYAAGTASAADLMNDAVAKICEMHDRQILILMDPALSEGLPENLKTEDGGHCKGIHQLTSALNQQIRALSVPSRNLSFSSEGNNQDIVPCAMAALNQLNSAVELSDQVIRAAAFTALRAYLLRESKALPDLIKLKNWNCFTLRDFDNLMTEISTRSHSLKV